MDTRRQLEFDDVFVPVSHTNGVPLNAQVVHQVEDAIRRGTIEVGDFLPPEPQPRGRDVVHAVAELVAERQDLGIVVVRVKPADKDVEMEASRAACFRMLARKLPELRDPEVALVVYDRRRVNEDKRDRATIKAMRQDGIVREKMSFLSATAGGERLLASADVVSFADHRALNENDREFFDLVKGSTTFLSARTNTYIPNTHMSVNAIAALDIHALSRQQSAHGATAEMAEKKDNPGVDR